MNTFIILTFLQSFNKKPLNPEIDLEEALTATQKSNFSSTKGLDMFLPCVS